MVRFSPKKAYIYMPFRWCTVTLLLLAFSNLALISHQIRFFKFFPGPRSTSNPHERVWTCKKATDRTLLSGITSHTCATGNSWCSFCTGSLIADNSRLDSCWLYWDLHMLHMLKTLLSVALSPFYVCLFQTTHPDLTPNNPPRMPSRP